MVSRGFFHYLDDFLVVGAPGSSQCADSLAMLLGWTKWLGLPVAPEKVEGPTSKLTFLGIEIDTGALILRLPAQKLAALKMLIASWHTRRWCLKSELQSLAGKLQHACKVVRPGRSFLCHIFELLKGTHCDHHHVRINVAFRSWHGGTSSWPPGMGCPCCDQQGSLTQIMRSLPTHLVVLAAAQFGIDAGCSFSDHNPSGQLPLLQKSWCLL